MNLDDQLNKIYCRLPENKCSIVVYKYTNMTTRLLLFLEYLRVPSDADWALCMRHTFTDTLWELLSINLWPVAFKGLLKE